MNEKTQTDTSGGSNFLNWGSGMIIGIMFGIAFGIALNNLAIGIGIGIAFGAAFSGSFAAIAKKKATDAAGTAAHPDDAVAPGGADTDEDPDGSTHGDADDAPSDPPRS